jgi:microcystin-dependent protein
MAYIGEIRMFAGTFAPVGWMFCEGQVLSISQNDALFTLIGATYGGDGESTFALPDLRGRIPIHQGNGHILSEAAGVESVTLTVNQIPNHSHALYGAAGNGSQRGPQNNFLASSTLIRPYAIESPDSAMAPTAIGPIGSSQPHTNMQPYLCVGFIISLFGIYPSPT